MLDLDNADHVEASNHALKGAFFANNKERPHFITSSAEHPAIVAPLHFLERLGAQSVGKIPTRVDELDVDLLTMAGHKFHAPKGVGALYVRDGLQLERLIHGAGHENGLRAGTESAMLTASLGMAADLGADLAPMGGRGLRDRFWTALRDAFGDKVMLNGHPDRRLPNMLNVSFVGRMGVENLAAMPEVAASTGSACHSGRIELSPVLEAMGIAPQVGIGAIRLSLGRSTTAEEIDQIVASLRRK